MQSVFQIAVRAVQCSLSLSGVCVCRRVARANSMSGAEGDVLVPMEAMGEAYNRLANHGRVGSAIKAGSA